MCAVALGIHNHSQSQSGVSGLLWLSSWFKSSARLHSSLITQQVFDSLSFVAPGKPIRILKSPASHCNFKITHVKECLCKYSRLVSIYPNSSHRAQTHGCAWCRNILILSWGASDVNLKKVLDHYTICCSLCMTIIHMTNQWGEAGKRAWSHFPLVTMYFNLLIFIQVWSSKTWHKGITWLLEFELTSSLNNDSLHIVSLWLVGFYRHTHQCVLFFFLTGQTCFYVFVCVTKQSKTKKALPHPQQKFRRVHIYSSFSTEEKKRKNSPIQQNCLRQKNHHGPELLICTCSLSPWQATK